MLQERRGRAARLVVAQQRGSARVLLLQHVISKLPEDMCRIGMLQERRGRATRLVVAQQRGSAQVLLLQQARLT